MKRMDAKVYERIRRGLTETFCYFARSDIHYDPYSPAKWISARQWLMFLKSFEVAAITGLSFESLSAPAALSPGAGAGVAEGSTTFGPTREPIEFVDFMELLSAIGRRTMEMLHRKTFTELNVYGEEPKTCALYRFTEVHSTSCF